MPQLAGEKSQASQRRYIRYTDQHGRKLGANIELSTGDPVGGWDYPKAPVNPPAHCISISRDPDNPFKVTIDYDRIIREHHEANDEYNAARSSLLRDHPQTPEREIVKLIGRRPMPVEPWIAAKQGDPWTLGLSSRVNIRVAGILEEWQVSRRTTIPEYDFTSEENYLDLEEAVDPKATGGQKVPVKRKTTKPAEEAA